MTFPTTMTLTTFRRIGAFLAVSLLGLALLTACSPRVDNRAAAEAYIRAHVSELSPTPAVLGGTFYVTDIEWEDDDTAVVSYEDGHVALRGRTEIREENGDVTVGTFTVLETGGGASSSSASSVSGRPKAKEGELCGGIAGIECDVGLMCLYEATHPDAAGTCVR